MRLIGKIDQYDEQYVPRASLYHKTNSHIVVLYLRNVRYESSSRLQINECLN